MKKLVALSAALFSAIAAAVPVEIWHGSMNLNAAPCSTLEWRNDGPFGTPSPTYVQSPQIKEGEIVAYVNNVQEWDAQVRQDVEQCAWSGVAAATVAALFTEGSGGWPAFQSTFYACIVTRAKAYSLIQSIELRTQNRCL